MTTTDQIIQHVLENEDEDDFKDLVAPTKPSPHNFTDADVDDGGHIWADRGQLVDDPLPWQKQGLQYTRTGYGAKIPSRYMVMFNGKLYRIYNTCYGNCGSAWFIAKGRKIHISG
jgi:hypothetical protein